MLVPNVFGHQMHVDPHDAGIHLEWLNGAPIRGFGGEIGFLRRNLKRGQRVVDVGANIGFFSLLFARQVGPKGEVIAFEPGPKSYRLLERNVLVNGYRNIRTEHAAVSDRTGATELLVCPTGESDNRLAAADAAERERFPVRCVALDDCVQGRVDFLKIDVQGSEPLVIRGARRILTENPRIVVVMEFWPRGMIEAGHSPADLLAEIHGLGFTMRELPETGRERRVTDAYLLGLANHCNLVLRHQSRLAKALEIIGLRMS